MPHRLFPSSSPHVLSHFGLTSLSESHAADHRPERFPIRLHRHLQVSPLEPSSLHLHPEEGLSHGSLASLADIVGDCFTVLLSSPFSHTDTLFYSVYNSEGDQRSHSAQYSRTVNTVITTSFPQMPPILSSSFLAPSPRLHRRLLPWRFCPPRTARVSSRRPPAPGQAGSDRAVRHA